MKDFFDPLGLALLAAILVPNLIFALTHRQGFENAVSCPRLERWEQVGRFGSLAFLVLRLPFLPWGEWFPGGDALSLPRSAGLAGILTGNWALTLFALLFAPCHITLSARNALAQRKETGL